MTHKKNPLSSPGLSKTKSNCLSGSLPIVLLPFIEKFLIGNLILRESIS